MKPASSPTALRVQAVLGAKYNVLEFEASTRTAVEAAAAIGCNVEQIAKSLVFRILESGRPALVIASGAVRVDEAKVGAVLGQTIGRADADFVRAKTGFAIGGVPPVGHAVSPVVVIDRTLEPIGTLWAAAGTPNAVFEISFADLVSVTRGVVADVERAGG